MRPQAYHRPQTLDEALRLLLHPQAAALAGGTRLLAEETEAAIMVDLQDLGLNQIDLLGTQLRIGAMARLQDIHDSGEISGGACHLLRLAIDYAGPNTYRHAATLGGVIANREPTSEVLLLLLVLNAKVMLIHGQQIQEWLLADYLAQHPRGLITEVIIPWEDGAGALTRVARTPADQAIVAVAAWRVGDGEIRLAACGIADYPLRLADGDFSMDETLAHARQALTHKGDFRGSSDYRRAMLGVLLRRAIVQTLAEESKGVTFG